MQEALGRDHGDPAGEVRVVDDAARAAEVVDVAVGVDQRRDGPLAAMAAVERERRGGGLGGDQRVDHDHAALALDERHVRKVQAAHLVDAVGHLEQAMDRGQL